MLSVLSLIATISIWLVLDLAYTTRYLRSTHYYYNIIIKFVVGDKIYSEGNYYFLFVRTVTKVEVCIFFGMLSQQNDEICKRT